MKTGNGPTAVRICFEFYDIIAVNWKHVYFSSKNTEVFKAGPSSTKIKYGGNFYA